MLTEFSPDWSDKSTTGVSVDLAILFFCLWTACWDIRRWLKTEEYKYQLIQESSEFITDGYRWIEYSISAPVMDLVSVFFLFIFEAYAVTGLVGLSLTTIIIGGIAERLPSKGERQMFTLLAFVPFIILHTVMWIQYYRVVTDDTPEFVSWLIGGLFASKAIFGIMQTMLVFGIVSHKTSWVTFDFMSFIAKTWMTIILLSRVLL
tara:strand:- start:296 stop:910 length:615 start_codon:yes stop_codon:yes gene_type:complete